MYMRCRIIGQGALIKQKENNERKLAALLDDPYCQDCTAAIRYMMEHGIRLEQEVIGRGIGRRGIEMA